MPSEVYTPGVNGRGQTQTLSKLTSEKVEARRASLLSQGHVDKDNDSQNGPSSPYRDSKRNSVISTGHVVGDGKRNSYDASSVIKDQRNNTSLVRDGYSNLMPKGKARPKPNDRKGSMTSYVAPEDGMESVENGVVANGDGQYQAHGEDVGVFPGRQKDARSRMLEAASVRRRFYDNADMEDVLQAKIATQLRENGIAETRVASLSAKISQAVRDDVIDDTDRSQPQVISNLRSAVNNHLDVILYNYPQHTDLSNRKTHDATHISQIVLMRIAQVIAFLHFLNSMETIQTRSLLGHFTIAIQKILSLPKAEYSLTPESSEIHNELNFCKQSLHTALKSYLQHGKINEAHGDSTTPRDTADSQERSLVMVIKEGIETQKTEAEIMTDKLRQLECDGDNAHKLKEKGEHNIKALDEENWQLKKCLQEADQDNEVLVAKVKDQEMQHNKMEKSLQAYQRDAEQLRKQIWELRSQGKVSAKELAILQSEKARLQVICDQRQKEILHLRDPDRDMLLQIRGLKEELTVLRTQSRRLGEERGMLRSKSQKLESALDESLKIRNKLTTERDSLFKENQELLQRYRKLSLATPSYRTLPEILTPRNSMSTRSTSRSTPRSDPNILILKNTAREESRLSTHKEVVEEENER